MQSHVLVPAVSVAARARLWLGQGPANGQLLGVQYAHTVALHTDYHLRIGVTGTVLVADFETISLLTQHAATNKLMQAGR